MRNTHWRASTQPTHPRRGIARTTLRGAAALTAAALSATLVPGAVSPAQAAPDLADGQVAVTVKIADQPPVEIAADRLAWPAQVLDATGADVDGNDLVKVVREGRRVKGDRKKVRHGDTVKVIDVARRVQVKKVRLAPRTVEVATTKLKPGKRKVVARGKAGVAKVRARRTTHNGELVEYQVFKRRTIKPAQPRRVLVGRKASSVPGTDGLNWGALANCESGGNPGAVNPAGYYGLYQFNVGTWNSVGGSGMPHHASAAEQTYRAKLLYKSRGAQPWPHCGRYL